MSNKPLNLEKFGRDEIAKYVAHTWFNYNSQRREKIEQWKELRNYVFATDTTTTTNSTLPWKNSTTLPKLCQIRDNLHSNYISALFPNDDWVRWEGYSRNDAEKNKATAIQAYIANKTRISNFRTVMSQLLYDYIDYGNAFATVSFENSFRELESGDRIVDYVGPVVHRISPLDIVFNPLAADFKSSWKIIRALVPVGELYNMLEDNPDNFTLAKAIERREELCKKASAYGVEDADKAEGMLVDGFGNYFEYLQSGYVELLTFYGDLFDSKTGRVRKGVKAVVIDRMFLAEFEDIPNWLGHAPVYHVGWRLRPDNLWAMGPLDNLVGMQYRIDHLENAKADAVDIAIHPPLLIQGEVEQFEWRPGAEIHLDENGSVSELGRNAQWVIQANNDIAFLEQRMEIYAGAPREAMGIRTPGEKTAFEVQQLQNAAGRIFQEKITTFEVQLLEPLLNAMIEVSRRNMDESDVIRVMDDDLGAQQFREITKEDITASGKIRPIGARHFAAQAQLMQNLNGVFSSAVGQMIAPHTSSIQLAKLVEDSFGMARFELFRPNVAVMEQKETQRLVNQAQEDLNVEGTQPV